LKRKVLVTIAVKKKYANFINQSSVAYVKGAGILGDKYIYIETKGEAPILPKDSFIKTREEYKDMERIFYRMFKNSLMKSIYSSHN